MIFCNRYSWIAGLVFLSVSAFAQQKGTAPCPCTTTSGTSDWRPKLINGYDTSSFSNNFAHSVNGVYVAEDADSLYQIKLIVDVKPYARFVHFQHLSFSKARLIDKQVCSCDELPNVHDGGWIGRNIFQPEAALNKRFVASEFFVGDNYLRVDQQHFYSLYQCDQKTEFGIIDPARARYYRKVHWQPEGDFTEISLFSFLQKDVKRYSKQQLAAMRNEVFARYNYKFKEGGKWYQYFQNKPAYRWNYFDNVDPFITTLERDNLSYIVAFESADYYDDQYHNPFLDFWKQFRESVQQSNPEKLVAQVQFPFTVYGEEDNMPGIKISRQQFAKVWTLLMQQENYDLNDEGKLNTQRSQTVIAAADAFADQMIHTKTNSLGNLNFEQVNGLWKLNSAYADFDLYPQIEKIAAVKQ